MQAYKNEQGQDVYRIEKITDLALLPDGVFERNNVFEQLEFFIANLRLIVAALKSEGLDANKIQSVFEDCVVPFVDLVDDGITSASFGVEGEDGYFYRAEVKP